MDNGEGLPQYIKDVQITTRVRPKRRKVSTSVLLANDRRTDGFLCPISTSWGGEYDHAGEGNRSQQVTDACKKHGGFYTRRYRWSGSCGAGSIKSLECVEYPELGMEAIWKIEVEDFGVYPCG